MNNTDISLKHALTAVFKTIMILVLFTAVLLFAKDQSFAAGDQTGDPDAAALTVILDGETVRTFTHKDLSDIAAAEGSKSYNYSFWDDSPAFGKEENVHGPSVDAVLEAAEIRKEVKSNGTVSFEGINGETSILTGRQLLDDTRYYYPNGDMVRYSEGLVPEDAYKNAVEVKSLISLDEESGNGLFVGQAAPNDQNAVVLVKGISAGGTIRISTKAAPVCAAPVMDPGKGTWRPGKEISITPGNESGGHQIIYFSYGRTSSPGYGSILYNYGNEQNMVCRPKVPADGKTVYVCASVRSYGMQDGAVLKKMFYIGDALTVKVDGEPVRLTPVEYKILELLSLQAGKVLTYSVIIGKVWGLMDESSVKRLQVNMANIRRKLGSKPGDNSYIVNELGVGYRMREPSAE